MTRRNPYVRCKKCRQLVTDARNCANCAANAENPDRQYLQVNLDGRKGGSTLDMQEGNWEEWQ